MLLAINICAQNLSFRCVAVGEKSCKRLIFCFASIRPGLDEMGQHGSTWINNNQILGGCNGPKIARQACKRPVTCLSRGGCQLCAANQVEMIYPHKYLDEMLPFPFLTLVQPDVNVFWVPALLACNVPMGESGENYLHTASA